MELQAAFGAEQNFPEMGPEVAPEKQFEKAPEDRQKVPEIETVWTRLDPNHLQLPEPQRRSVAEVARVAVAEQEPVRGSQPESVGDVLKAQTLPKLDIRPEHFYTEPEVRSIYQAAQEHDILPQIANEARHQKAETFDGRASAPAPIEQKSELPASSQELHLGRHELMLLAGTISVEGTNLLEIFSANRIDEDGLRRIVGEFLQGKPIEQLVAQEELRQQKKFELDPNLRHSPDVVPGVASQVQDAALKPRKTVNMPQVDVSHHANNFASFLVSGVGRLVEERDEPMSPGKIAAWTVGTVLYFIVLIWALRR